MVAFETETSINRPVQEVFGFVANPQNYAKWMSGLTLAEPLTPSPLGVGSKVRLVGKLALWKFDSPMEITEYEPNHKFGISSTIPGAMQFKAIWKFEPTGDSTTRVAESGNASLLGLWKLLEPMFAREVKEGEAQELAKIKTLLENPA
jgi:carbon monoxide dehydrogenase subunit G